MNLTVARKTFFRALWRCDLATALRIIKMVMA